MLEDTDGALGKKTEENAEQEKQEKVEDNKERSRSKEKSSKKHKAKKGMSLMMFHERWRKILASNCAFQYQDFIRTTFMAF